MTLLGGYVLFWLAFKCEWPPLRRINAKNDISYGVYLYAFPLTQLIIFFWRDIHVGVLVLATFLLSLICGSLSWHLVERPALGDEAAAQGAGPRARGTRQQAGLIPPAGLDQPSGPLTSSVFSRPTGSAGAPAGKDRRHLIDSGARSHLTRRAARSTAHRGRSTDLVDPQL